MLAFWREAGSDRWYKKDGAFDDEVRRRFLGLWREAAAGKLSSWETSDDGALALTIVLDQFPRNMFRGDPLTFSSDAMAREVAAAPSIAARMRGSIPCCWNSCTCRSCIRSICPTSLRCVELFRKADNTEQLKYALDHADIVGRFGRFPHRNQVLGRETTPQEQAFLDAGGFSG